ncbi:MAG: hypothetical protein ABI637_07400 [Gemmatimonadota bacterium]
MSLSHRSLRPIWPVLVATFGFAAAPAAHAQSPSASIGRPEPKFSITAAITSVQVGNQNQWGFGPELGFRRDFGKWGARLNLAVPAFGSNAGGAAIDLGPSLVSVRGKTEFGASVGLSALLIGDNSELTDGGLGVYASGHAMFILSRRFGVMAGVTLRSTGSNVYPSVSGGLVLRL